MPIILDGSLGITFPAGGTSNPAGTVVGTTDTQTLTNKSIVASQLTGTIAAARLPTGSVLQVVSATYSTPTTTASTSFVTTGLNASITPTSSSNKILIMVTLTCYRVNFAYSGITTIFRGTVAGTNLGDATWGLAQLYNNSSLGLTGSMNMNYLDSPATTSSTTYTVGMKAENAAVSVTSCPNNGVATIILMEVAG